MSQFSQEPTLHVISQSHELIKPYIHRTPVLTCKTLDQMAGAQLYFKCENFQKVGAFKFRGGIHSLLRLSPDERQRGVATHSSGNHAQAIAHAAQLTGAPAFIVMPSSAPEVKKKAVVGYGAQITFCEPTLQARERTLEEVIAATGASAIHPYDDYRVITGQATCAKELIEDQPELDAIVAPVGGGGLLAGTLLATRYYSEDTLVFAGEPAGADDAYRSFKAGKLIPQTQPQTIADGLLTSLGQRNFKIISKYLTDIYRVDDEEIIAAMRLIWERMKIIIEPSCAVPLAAILKHKEHFEGKKVGVILTGGNVDLSRLPF